jgi:hypothetical protein
MTDFGSVPTLLRETWTISPGFTVKLVTLNFIESFPLISIDVVATWARRDTAQTSAHAKAREMFLIFMVIYGEILMAART